MMMMMMMIEFLCHLLLLVLLLGLIFDPEDGGDMILRSVTVSSNYTASQPGYRPENVGFNITVTSCEVVTHVSVAFCRKESLMILDLFFFKRTVRCCEKQRL
jgi:hypothetical protein